MKNGILVMVLAGAVEALACSPNDVTRYRYDTLESGALRLVATTEIGTSQNPRTRFDTLGVYHPADLESKLRASLQDSALVFIGRFDSLWTGTGTPSPLLSLDSATGFQEYEAVLRLRIDTVLKGTFPHPNPVWIRVQEGLGSCSAPFQTYLNRPFLNASPAFFNRSHLKFEFDIFPEYSPYPQAAWFSGRYLSDPDFPGLRLDITKILTDYPATGIAPRRLPARAPAAPSGKAYLPNGREARGPDGRGNPVPTLR